MNRITITLGTVVDIELQDDEVITGKVIDFSRLFERITITNDKKEMVSVGFDEIKHIYC